MRKLIFASFLNPLDDKHCDVILQGAMVVKYKSNNKNAVIEFLGDSSKAVKKFGKFDDVLDMRDKLIMPGFFDMHFHWVQDDVRMMPKDSLLSWLEKYTFPTEHKFADKKYAKEKAQAFFKDLIKNGTLGGACYSSIHGHALDYAFKYATGDYVIGNVLMTQNSPDFLKQIPKNAIKLVTKFSEKYKKRYALTPRFAIATDAHTMKETSKIAKKHGAFLQTHLSETTDEIDFVKSLYKTQKGFEKIESYTEIYKKVGMLSPKTIMGHGIHLDDKELAMLAKSKTAIAHCPTSNAPHEELGLGSGLFDFKKIEKAGVRWALASDIGGGPYLSMFDVMRSFVEQNQKANVKGATLTKALYRSTLAGAEILKYQKAKGNLCVGKEANFIVLNMPKLDLSNKTSAEEILQAIIIPLQAKRNEYENLVQAVYYQGKQVDEE
jgi:guanine deaminase